MRLWRDHCSAGRREGELSDVEAVCSRRRAAPCTAVSTAGASLRMGTRELLMLNSSRPFMPRVGSSTREIRSHVHQKHLRRRASRVDFASHLHTRTKLRTETNVGN